MNARTASMAPSLAATQTFASAASAAAAASCTIATWGTFGMAASTRRRGVGRWYNGIMMGRGPWALAPGTRPWSTVHASVAVGGHVVVGACASAARGAVLGG